MRKLTFAVILCSLPAIAGARDWNTRTGDQPLTASELHDQLVGNTLIFFDNGRSVYAASGEYSYTYGEGGTWLGHYELKEDGVACTTFVTGSNRCDLIVQNGTRLTLITEDGLRFPIRDIIPIK
ncbi:hypothetical protein MWU53_06185 [Aliiroseovarius sp. S1123]|jgi:hypothetical protein|uniref:hypothetical protein n=1 Tax=Aliiroseovarius sp. S1123 TaxID=2926404 RepID=UPI001FF21187|nr:hypothetical protein [Aliiroseovarius sp. S1123]MCK0170643.1 hypothetical protein [Aliiroseovarius sp. S1123]